MPLGVDIREQRAPYVVFERKGVEDREQSLLQGRYMEKPIDFAIVTPIGSKDRIPREVQSWFKTLEQNIREERIPKAWLEQYREAYAAWKRGEEVPLAGTPVKGWAVLSSAQQANIISANILTVEDLAQVNDEGVRRIGMGAIELRDKAIAWLKSARDSGVVTQQNAALQARIRQLESNIEVLTGQIRDLKAENEDFAQKLQVVKPKAA
jgi:hypothetical protein